MDQWQVLTRYHGERSTRSPPPSSYSWDETLVAHSVDDVIDAKFKSLIRKFDGVEALRRPFPVVTDVVVEVDNQLQPPRLILNAPKFWLPVTEVSGRKHIQCFDLVKLLKNGVLDGQPLQIPFRKNLADRPLENSPIAGPVEVIKNDNARPVQILSKIGGFLRSDHPA